MLARETENVIRELEALRARLAALADGEEEAPNRRLASELDGLAENLRRFADRIGDPPAGEPV